MRDFDYNVPTSIIYYLPLIILCIFIDLDNWEIMLNHCCNIGKTWSMDTKSCNISLTIPISDVPNEHNSMCLTTVGACCLHSLRYVVLFVCNIFTLPTTVLH